MYCCKSYKLRKAKTEEAAAIINKEEEEKTHMKLKAKK